MRSLQMRSLHRPSLRHSSSARLGSVAFGAFWLLAALCLGALAACDVIDGQGGRARSSAGSPETDPSAGSDTSEAPRQGAQPGRPIPPDREPTGRPRLDPAGDLCENLCVARGSCFNGFRDAGLDPVLDSLLSKPPVDCLSRCREIRNDPLLGGLVRIQMKACLLGQLNAPPRAEDCDAFLGCALRQRLLFLKREPWKRTLLDTRDLVARVTRAMKAGEVDAASRGCVEGTSLRQALSALVSEGKAAGSRETLEALDERCGAAMEAEILRLAKAVEEAVRELRADPAQEACRALERLRVHPYRAGSEALSARLAESARACAALEPLRSLATAVADAEADSALVARELEGGRGAGVTSYHKCVHKAATLATLEASEHPRARRAAKTLREVCFQRFPVEWLRAEQRHREAPDRARCFRITQVARLITESSPSPAFLAAQAALLKWSREACR